MNDSDSDVELLAELSDSESWVYSSSDTDTDTDLSSDDSDDSAELSDVRTWCSIDCDTDQAAPPRFPFTGAPGMKVDIEHDNPLAYLQLFLTDEVIEKIVTETNRYKEQQSATLYRKFSRIRWEPVTKNDIWNFLGLIILQGVVKKPLQKWYWSTNKLLETPFFGTVMTEYRFSLIMKCLHFSNNQEFDETTHPTPKLRKIWEVFQMVVKNFQQTYVPERDISIDESLMAYKGRLSWIQYIASKRARFGIKSYMLCESSTGYIWNSHSEAKQHFKVVQGFLFWHKNDEPLVTFKHEEVAMQKRHFASLCWEEDFFEKADPRCTGDPIMDQNREIQYYEAIIKGVADINRGYTHADPALYVIPSKICNCLGREEKQLHRTRQREITYR
ncbi:LOW QUALITY PROTEIN: piggyBac transposable element-derived protein 4-like [Mantella aurantiaca]